MGSRYNVSIGTTACCLLLIDRDKIVMALTILVF